MSTTEIISIITTLVAIAGFIGLIIQLKNLQKGLNSDARGSIYDMSSKLKETFIEYPHLRKYFFNNIEIDPNSQNFDRVCAIADFYCLYLEQMSTQLDSIEKNHKRAWIKYIVDSIDNSPAIRTHINSNKGFYSELFLNHIHSHL